ncbi:MAG TPA: DNA primase DnaG [archaeon]|nr:DNA primase DnaG [archaeon]
MGKTYIETIKYMIVADFEVNGLVERPDVIGAIFGQSEGLLGANLDIKELQQNGKIGRIEIEYNQNQNKVRGVLKLPCSVSMVETAIIAASIETIEKVGPCDASFKIKQIEDTRGLKRQQIKERAIELLGRLMQEEIPDTKELMEEIMDTFKTKDIISYGPEKLAAGPTVDSSKELIVVEGRADVLTLLRYGFTNAIATGGARIPRSLDDISRNKTVTIFLDGDHGGDIQQQQLIKSIKVDYIARAPDGKEVEELTQKEINQALRRRIKSSYVSSSNNNQSTQEIKQPSFNPNLTKQAGIVKATKFSTTANDNRNPSKFFENKPQTKFVPQQAKPITGSDDFFNNLLSEIPDIERVDVSRDSRDRNNRRDNNSRDRNNRFDNHNRHDNHNRFDNHRSDNQFYRQEEKSITDMVKEEVGLIETKQNTLQEYKKDKVIQKPIFESKTISKTTISKSDNSLKAELEKKIAEIVEKKVSEPEVKIEKPVEKKEEIKPKEEPKKKPIVLPKITDEIKQNLSKIIDDIKDKSEARLLNEKFRRISSCSASDLEHKLRDFTSDKLFAIAVDSDLNDTIKDLAKEKGARILVVKNSTGVKDSQIHLMNYQELGK